MSKYPEPQDNGIIPGKLTRREKQLLKRMDQDDKYDAQMARRDGAKERAAKKADAKALAKNKARVIRKGSKIIKKNAAAKKKGK